MLVVLMVGFQLCYLPRAMVTADERVRPWFDYQALVYVRGTDNARHVLPQTRY